MRVSELVRRSGVPLATVKYYLREGVLMPGVVTGATTAEYGEEHLHRLALIKALAGAGLPINKIRVIVELIEHPGDDLHDTIGRAIAALPPYREEPRRTDHPRARRALERLGQVYNPSYPAVEQFERALEAVEKLGIPMTDDRLDAYGRHIRGIAEIDLALMPTESAQAAVEYSVLGTAVYEPVITAMRRLAHQDISEATRGESSRPAPDRPGADHHADSSAEDHT